MFATKAGKIECTKLSVSGEVEELTSTTQLVTVQYESCTAFGFISAKISPAEYLFMSNGTVDLKKTLTIETVGCVVTAPAQNGLGAVTYTDSGEGLAIKVNVSGIESEGTGSNCSYAKEKSGTNTGNSFVELAGGKIEFGGAGGGGALFEIRNPGGALKNPPKAGEERVIEVENVGVAAGSPTGLPEAEIRIGGGAVGGFYEVRKVAECKAMLYAIGAKCNIEVKVLKVTAGGEKAVKWEAAATPGNAKNKVSLVV